MADKITLPWLAESRQIDGLFLIYTAVQIDVRSGLGFFQSYNKWIIGWKLEQLPWLSANDIWVCYNYKIL